ncbi:hypothetical protein V1511DRAFT_167570 [Dipodascopsis uninucleata]
MERDDFLKAPFKFFTVSKAECGHPENLINNSHKSSQHLAVPLATAADISFPRVHYIFSDDERASSLFSRLSGDRYLDPDHVNVIVDLDEDGETVLRATSLSPFYQCSAKVSPLTENQIHDNLPKELTKLLSIEGINSHDNYFQYLHSHCSKIATSHQGSEKHMFNHYFKKIEEMMDVSGTRCKSLRKITDQLRPEECISILDRLNRARDAVVPEQINDVVNSQLSESNHKYDNQQALFNTSDHFEKNILNDS